MQNKLMHTLETGGQLVGHSCNHEPAKCKQYTGTSYQVWVTVKEPETNTMDATG